MVQYFFLAAFMWMLCEGILLYLMLVVVFVRLRTNWWAFLLLGWGEGKWIAVELTQLCDISFMHGSACFYIHVGLPLVLVAPGMAMRYEQYATVNQDCQNTRVM